MRKEVDEDEEWRPRARRRYNEGGARGGGGVSHVAEVGVVGQRKRRADEDADEGAELSDDGGAADTSGWRQRAHDARAGQRARVRKRRRGADVDLWAMYIGEPGMG